MTLVMIYVETGARVNSPLCCMHQMNRYKHAEFCRRSNYSGSFCDSNMKTETETYAAHSIFMQLASIIWNDQESLAFLKKMNHILHRH